MQDIIIRGSHSQTRVPMVRKQACCYAPEHSDYFKSQQEVLPSNLDLVCFSQIRWNQVFQRPQYLMSRWARTRRVFFIEPPVIERGTNVLRISKLEAGVMLITPHITPEADRISVQQKLLADFIFRQKINNFVSWYNSPIFLPYTSHLNPRFIVYDCMDEFSEYAGEPSKLQESESNLMTISDLVFTEGLTLFQVRSQLHSNIHAFPSSIDFDHFSKARGLQIDPLDQREIPNPRIGYYGVIDERMDQELIDTVASQRPDWNWVFVGPVLKINPDKLPKRPNIYYLGEKDYRSLPAYVSGWDVAVIPFVRNYATCHISPTKTTEFLAAGTPVVSTSIPEVVRPYGERGLVCIANDPAGFIASIQKSFGLGTDWLNKVDAYLWNLSWDQTWIRMNRLLAEVHNDANGSHTSAPRASLPAFRAASY